LPCPPATPRRPLRAAAAALLLFLTAACAGPGLEERPRFDPALTRALAALAHPDAPVRLDAPPGQSRALDGALLNGLTADDVTVILGPPARTRHDPPAQVWLFERPRCFVDVFLYDEGDGSRVVYVQERSRRVKKIRPGACLGEVWQSWQEKPR